MSLLREIQNDVANDDGNVTRVLRKCKILAARLKSSELAQWVDWELNGYPEDHAVPPYRCLPITHYASFHNAAWQLRDQPVPIQFVPKAHQDAFCQVSFREGIAKANALAHSNGGAYINKPELIFALQGKMYPDMNCQGVYGRIGALEFKQLISGVKNRLLDFSLNIEAENPDAGEAGPGENPVPKETVRVIFQNIFNAPVGNVAQDSQDFSQRSNMGPEPGDLSRLSRLIAELENHIDELGLDGQQKQRAEAQIAALKAELDGNPDPEIVQQAGRTLRNITEGAIGSLLATAAQPGVWHWIHQMLGSFSR